MIVNVLFSSRRALGKRVFAAALALATVAVVPPGTPSSPVLALSRSAFTTPLVAQSDEHLSSSAGEIVLRPLVHASVRIDFAGRTIYVDPWAAIDLSTSPASDLIIITDADSGAHHLDPAALQQVRRAGGTVVMPATGREKVPDGVVMPNGATRTFGNVTVESVAAYDLTPGEPYHPKGQANGYVLTMGGRRVYFAGVTECVPEIKALRDIDVAFLPMNLPNGRMTPEGVGECVRSFRPRVVYPYHYDQGYNARRAGRGAPGGAAAAAATVRVLADGLRGVADVREADWYPER